MENLSNHTSIFDPIEKEIKVPNIGGYSCIQFLKSGNILLIDKSRLFDSVNEVKMNGFECLYDFLNRNLRKITRDELIFKISKEIGRNCKNIKIPYQYSVK